MRRETAVGDERFSQILLGGKRKTIGSLRLEGRLRMPIEKSQGDVVLCSRGFT